ncbi:MAG: hypothetical protein M1833_004489 [Piccolia ochrophora]|nr:MAG: hypothetical protein M1833_004489 [Piccolia ochrophora]
MSRPSTTSRPAAASKPPPAPKPPTTISARAIISDTAIITGTHPVTIGESAVLHPRATLLASHGPVTVGANCIICERSVVGLSAAPSNGDVTLPVEGVVVEDDVMIDVGAKVEASRVGEGSVIEVNAIIGRGAVIGKDWATVRGRSWRTDARFHGGVRHDAATGLEAGLGGTEIKLSQAAYRDVEVADP